MSKKSNIIELNGHQYDAHSGALLTKAVAQPHLNADNFVDLSPAKPVLKSIAKKPVVDGFVTNPSTAQRLHVKTHKSTTLRRSAVRPKPTAAAKVVTVKSQSTTKPTTYTAHAQVKSATLMRSVVKKPVIERKPLLKAQTNTAALIAKPAQGITHKRMSDVVDNSRLVRAIKTPTHKHISRFAKAPQLAPSFRHITVTPVPVSTASRTARPAPFVEAKKSVDIFARAIETAQSHNEVYIAPKKVPRHRRLVLTTGVSFALLISVFGIAYFNRTAIQMQFASAQAGFKAQIPRYVPDGYIYEGITQEPGKVTAKYTAQAQESSYSISEQPSAWNSQTLLDNFVSTTQQSYQTEQVGGQTYFVYGNNVTWVNAGVWYRLQTSGNPLSKQQLIQVASSI